MAPNTGVEETVGGLLMSTAFAYDDARRPAPMVTAPFAFGGAAARQPEPEFPGFDERPVGLEVVRGLPARRARPRVLAVSGLVAGVGCVLAAQLLLSIQTAAGAYAVTQLQSTSTSLARQQQVATEHLERLSAPQNLARDAQALGMVPSTTSAGIRLSDGAIVGASPTAQESPLRTADVPDALLDGIPTASR